MSSSPAYFDTPSASSVADDIEVVYEVTAKFVVTAAVSAGLLSKSDLADLVNNRANGLLPADIEGCSILEVRHMDRVIAYAMAQDKHDPAPAPQH